MHVDKLARTLVASILLNSSFAFKLGYIEPLFLFLVFYFASSSRWFWNHVSWVPAPAYTRFTAIAGWSTEHHWRTYISGQLWMSSEQHE